MFNPDFPFDLPLLPPPIGIKEHPNFQSFLTAHNRALTAISELKGSLSEVDNPSLFLSSFYLQESISSNAVENIYTTMESVLEDETKPERERTSQNKEVINYRNALLAGQATLKDTGLSSKTIKTVHKALKVKKGIPGEFRTQQNKIKNKKTDGLEETIYTPPAQSKLNELLSNWENFVHTNEDFFPLLKAIICHYQFEAIHPFEDGNGRTGRIIMVLQLIHDGLLGYPAFFISSYLSEKEDYYKKFLLNVTAKSDWWAYIEFMLTAFAIQSYKTRIAMLQLKESRKSLREELYNQQSIKIRKTNIKIVVDHLFQNPMTHPRFMETATGIHWQTCSKYLSTLSKAGFLEYNKIGKYAFYKNRHALNALVVKSSGSVWENINSFKS